MDKRVIILYMALFLLVLLDIVTTIELLKLPGGTEANPLVIFQWQEQIGFENSLKLRIGSVLFLGCLIWLISKMAKTEHDQKVASKILMLFLSAITIIMFLIVANNIRLILWFWSNGIS